VDVRVTLDRTLGMLPLVRRECRAAYRRLRSVGIDVALSDPRPLAGTPRGRPASDHHKFLVADDREALVGGMNVGTPFFRHHDVMIHVKGPAAAELAAQFDHDRLPRPAGERTPPPAVSDADDVPNPDTFPGPHNRETQSRVRVLGTGPGRRTTLQAVLRNLRAARSAVFVAMSEMGRTEALAEVIAARRRGVDVRVLLDPQDMGEYLPPALGPLRRRFPRVALNALAIRELLDAGVAVRLFDVGEVGAGKAFALMHLKMALFDAGSGAGRAIAGSTNWTRAGFSWISETDVELHGGRVVDELLAQFTLDWESAHPVTTAPPRSSKVLCRLYERSCQ
jgi:phosphatidylserine/phosphatidylglycerophosphate/cardiolipin synthase-like enzyme